MAWPPPASLVMQASRMKSSMPGSANTLGSCCAAIRCGFIVKNQSSSRLMSASDRGEAIAIAGQRLQLAFLALEAAPERIADARCRRRARRHRQQRTIIGRGLARQQRKRIGLIHPAPRLLRQRQHVGLRVRADHRHQCVEIGFGRGGGKILAPQRHVEGGMLAAEKSRDARAALALYAERQQQQRLAVLVVGDDDERPDAFAFADLALPCREKIETLIRRGKLVGLFEAAPDGFRLTHVADKFDAGNAACLRPRLRSRSGFDHGRHGHPHNPYF